MFRVAEGRRPPPAPRPVVVGALRAAGDRNARASGRQGSMVLTFALVQGQRSDVHAAIAHLGWASDHARDIVWAGGKPSRKGGEQSRGSATVPACGRPVCSRPALRWRLDVAAASPQFSSGSTRQQWVPAKRKATPGSVSDMPMAATVVGPPSKPNPARSVTSRELGGADACLAPVMAVVRSRSAGAAPAARDRSVSSSPLTPGVAGSAGGGRFTHAVLVVLKAAGEGGRGPGVQRERAHLRRWTWRAVRRAGTASAGSARESTMVGPRRQAHAILSVIRRSPVGPQECVSGW